MSFEDREKEKACEGEPIVERGRTGGPPQSVDSVQRIDRVLDEELQRFAVAFERLRS